MNDMTLAGCVCVCVYSAAVFISELDVLAVYVLHVFKKINIFLRV